MIDNLNRSPYGKQAGTQLLSDFPFHCGVPPSTVSSLQKWEGPDPAFWCSYDYAIINVDIRGTYTSEGDASVCSHTEASDGAEFITWVSQQPWCNGKVALSGNSWLAVCQWKIASLRPAGLAAVAPWEGLGDLYRDAICKGGIPDTGFVQAITSAFAGQGQLEDMAAGLDKSNGLWDAYWEDKRSVVERINVPIYAVACWTSLAHTPGTLRAWRNVPNSVPKWLRVHNTMEWPDYYEHRNIQDLKRFYDFYLKGIDTNWLATPKIRLSVLNFGMGLQPDTVDRAESEWPLARTKYVKHFLTSHNTLSLTPPNESSEIKYGATSGSAVFEYTIPDNIETTGYPRCRLHVSSPDHTEIDIFVQIEKYTAGPRPRRVGTLVIRPKTGPWAYLLKLMHDWQIGTTKLGLLYHWGSDGRLRASHATARIIEDDFDKIEPRYRHEKRNMLESGEIRCLDIPMRPYGLWWEKGDVLRFTIKGEPVIPFAIPGTKGPSIDNKGMHVIHCGGKGEESSCLVLPIV